MTRAPSGLPTAVQFGAGSIGRGFLGQIFSEAGLEVVFVEVRPDIVGLLNARGSYPLRLAGPDRFAELSIGPVRAIDARDLAAVAREVAEAAVAGTAVGVAALVDVARALAAGVAARAAAAPPLNVLLAENQLRCSDLLRGLVAGALPAEARVRLDRLGLVETVVSRMVPEIPAGERQEDPLRVIAEDYYSLPADARGFAGSPPVLPAVMPVPDLLRWVERKFYLHNMGHAAAAYLGYRRGHATLAGAMADAGVAERVAGAMAETSTALARRHGFDREELRRHAADLRRRFQNPALGDTVARVARDPLRKLRPEDRLTGSIHLCLDEGVEPRCVLEATAAALAYDAPGDPGAAELQRLLAGEGLDAVLSRVCGLPPGGEVAGMLRAAIERLRA